ncbi:MAG: hypothetical protein methR_P3011 [Methyloprofundus sp.]|nr:MAG: hypothetical protein methR_P3011 [Methyloprofundus sp.]
MDIKFVVALIGLTGVLISALVQFYLGRRADLSKKNIEVRTQAYLDLINSVSEIASSNRYNEDRSLEQLQKLNQAKTRVILIGSNEVIMAIKNFWSEFGTLNSDEAFSSFSLIVSAMRKDLSGDNSLSLKLISEALFGKQTKA